MQCRKLWGHSTKFTQLPKLKTSSSGFAAKVSLCHTAPNGSKRDTTVLYSISKRKLFINPEAMLEHTIPNICTIKAFLVNLPTTSATLQVAQTWELPSKSDCIRKYVMKKLLFRDQDFTIINVKMHEFRRWDYTASNKFWNGNLKLVAFIRQLWSLNRS